MGVEFIRPGSASGVTILCSGQVFDRIYNQKRVENFLKNAIVDRMSEKIIQNWLALADYDYETANAMMQSGRYIYVAFTCQQAVEKTLKAFFVQEHQITPPYTHNLLTLASKISCSQVLLCDYQETLEDLNS